MNPVIRQLDPIIIDQIAAGEVVERPGSVVKELVENAIDSGADRIEIILSEGGLKRIEVRDNGCGIPLEELELAVSSHATSKLRSAEDLECVVTLGFRGEALASIAAVSRMEIISRRDKGEGNSLRVRFGRREPVRPASCPGGTRVVVEDIFAELPARLKFMKRISTELRHCSVWVERLSLAHPGVGFRLEHEGRKLFEVLPDDQLDQRCRRVFGDGVGAAMVSLSYDSAVAKLEAMVGPPESARRNATQVNIFLNGRWVRDPRLLRAVKEGVREFLPIGHYPTIYLALAVPPERVDVNVHPQKTEVRFRDERQVIGVVIKSIQRGLSQAPWSTRAAGSIGGSFGGLNPPGYSWERPLEAVGLADRVADGGPQVSAEPPVAAQVELGFDQLEVDHDNFLAVARTFLVRELPGGMEIIDQHALHERVNLEELRAEIRKGKVVSQPLLIPLLVEVDRSELDLLCSKAEVFSTLGISLEAFGETTIAINAVPARLSRLQPQQLVMDLLEIASEFRAATADQLQEETLHRISCRGAVMAGDYLDHQALADLLKRGANLPQDRTCAHGRPIRVFLSHKDLEKAFYRR